MPRPLKVYAADIDGLHEWIVAAPNQSAALAAWGVHQNLFAQGAAHPTDAPDAVAAAQAAPGEPLRRRAGSEAAFVPVSRDSDVSGWEAAAKAVGARKPPRPKPGPSKSELDRRAQGAAQAALDAFEARAKAELSDLSRRRRDLEAQAADLEARLDRERTGLEAALKAAARRGRTP